MITKTMLSLLATTLLFASMLVAAARYLHPATFAVATYSILLAGSALLLTVVVIRRA